MRHEAAIRTTTMAVIILASTPARGDLPCVGPALAPCPLTAEVIAAMPAPEEPVAEEAPGWAGGSGGGQAGVSWIDVQGPKIPKAKIEKRKVEAIEGHPLTEQFEYVARKVLRQQTGRILNCFEKAMLADEKLGGGPMKVRLTVAPSGKVVKMEVIEDGVGHKPLTGCLKGAFYPVELLPREEEGNIVFDYGFVLVPPAIPGQSSRNHPFLVEIAPRRHVEKISGTTRITSLLGMGSSGIATSSTYMGKSGYDPQLPKTESDYVFGQLDRQMESFATCYAKALKKKPDLGGRMVVRFKVTKKGKVIKPAVAKSSVKHKGLAKCVLARFPEMSFHTHQGTVAVWQAPLRFLPDRLSDWPAQQDVSVNVPLTTPPGDPDLAKELSIAVKDSRDDIAACFSPALALDPDLESVYQFAFKFPEGKEMKVQSTGVAKQIAGERTCIEEILGGLDIAPHDGPYTTAVVRVQLVNPWWEDAP